MPTSNGRAGRAAAATNSDPDSPERSAKELAAFQERLERAAEAVDDQRDALASAIELRDELIAQGRDLHAMTTTALARVTGISQARVVVILGNH